MITREDIYNQYGLGNTKPYTCHHEKWGIATNPYGSDDSYLKYDESAHEEQVEKIREGLAYDLTKQNTF